jgi:hypothetical protein
MTCTQKGEGMNLEVMLLRNNAPFMLTMQRMQQHPHCPFRHPEVAPYCDAGFKDFQLWL